MDQRVLGQQSVIQQIYGFSCFRAYLVQFLWRVDQHGYAQCEIDIRVVDHHQLHGRVISQLLSLVKDLGRHGLSEEGLGNHTDTLHLRVQAAVTLPDEVSILVVDDADIDTGSQELQ